MQKPAQPAQQTMDPSYRNISGMSKLDPKINPQTGKSFFTGPTAGNIQQAIKTYESMGSYTPNQDPNAGAMYIKQTADGGGIDSWRNRLYSERNATANRRSGGGGGGNVNQNAQAAAAIPTPDMPKYEAQAYAPPGEDPGVYNAARAEAMGPGIRALREGTREAISSAQSLDNPNARGKFIKQALQGYGQGLESVSAGASREGRQVAGQKRAEQLDIYRTNYNAKNDAYLKNYQNEINTIATQFAQDQAGAMAGGGMPTGSANSRYSQIRAKQAAAGGSGRGF